jgi:hypothetical protein
MRKYQLIERKVVAVTSTQVEQNIVVLSTALIADPQYRIGLLLEISSDGPRPWDAVHAQTLLLLNGLVYSLIEKNLPSDLINKNLPSSDNLQEFYFSLVDEVGPQLEGIIEKVLTEI